MNSFRNSSVQHQHYKFISNIECQDRACVHHYAKSLSLFLFIYPKVRGPITFQSHSSLKRLVCMQLTNTYDSVCFVDFSEFLSWQLHNKQLYSRQCTELQRRKKVWHALSTYTFWYSSPRNGPSRMDEGEVSLVTWSPCVNREEGKWVKPTSLAKDATAICLQFVM